MAEQGGDLGAGRVTIDHLIALNDEIVAMTRAGVPIEQGLLDLGSDVPGRLGRIAKALGERMSRGEGLTEALAAPGVGAPRVYRAVVEAGVKSGRLSVALEGLASYARGYSEARRSIGMALWYPLVVLSLAYAMFLGLATTLMPRFVGAFLEMGLPLSAPVHWLDLAGRTAWYWGPVFPVVLAVFLAAWVHSRRGFGARGNWSSWVLRGFPWMGSMIRWYEAAGFADLLALLVEHGVPYPEALRLAGEASGDPSFARSSRELAAAVERGLAPAEALKGSSAIPSLLRWLVATSRRQGEMVTALRQMATRYRGMARHQADKIRVFLPTILLFGVGGTATALYALALFVPLTSLWTSLARIAP
jgi:general secretion pathway protein F